MKISLKNILFIGNRGRLPYCKALNKSKLISIKKWRQGTDPKKMEKVWFPFVILLTGFYRPGIECIYGGVS